MTTIAVMRYEDGRIEMAADRKSFNEFKSLETPKLEYFEGCMWACCGVAQDCDAFGDWMRSGMQKEEYPPGLDNFSALVVTSRCEIREYQSRHNPINLSDQPYWAIGSGEGFAHAYLAIGKTPKEAIELIIEHRLCQYTGFGVDSKSVIDTDDCARLVALGKHKASAE